MQSTDALPIYRCVANLPRQRGTNETNHQWQPEQQHRMPRSKFIFRHLAYRRIIRPNRPLTVQFAGEVARAYVKNQTERNC